MAFVVMQQRDVNNWVYAEMDEHCDVREHATEAAARTVAERLGWPMNGYRVVAAHEAATLYQLGEPYHVQYGNTGP